MKFGGDICGGVLVENASDDFPQQRKLENLPPNFAGSSPPISPKTSPTSLWKSLVLKITASASCRIEKPRNRGNRFNRREKSFFCLSIFLPFFSFFFAYVSPIFGTSGFFYSVAGRRSRKMRGERTWAIAIKTALREPKFRFEFPWFSRGNGPN